MSELETGRVASQPGSQGFAPQPLTASSPIGADPSREEFCARFKAYMIATTGDVFEDGDSIADYATEVAPTYFDQDWQRCQGPEACAEADMSYWGE